MDQALICNSQNDFTRGKPCLACLVTFCDGVTVVVDVGKATDVIYLRLFKAVDTVPHNIFVSKLERDGFDGRITWWIRNWLSSSTQRVVVSWSLSKWRTVTSVIPQGAEIGSAPFNIFVGDMNSGIKGTLCKFSDDTKLCGAFDTLDGRLEKWACAKSMKFNRAKCKVLHVGFALAQYTSWAKNGLKAAQRIRTLGGWWVRHSM
ncbi:RNA-directed DNA polymerase from mobile element jockey-like protein [Willisornis vidua]|uniref:RNA-directed DNA polymerase from mobile element jockey-like protein n=1 Tax=Willisornis vidua TaxID=1566151 RepID=A0ABQ9DNQ0_9PASS|nr:RNA-directed DNA polymerase from mobile element jockey-like protein [Willisornis vidua]